MNTPTNRDMDCLTETVSNAAPSAEMEVAQRLIARSEEAHKRGTFHSGEEWMVPLARAYVELTRRAAGRFEPVSYAEVGNTDSFAPTIDKTYQRDGSAKWKISRAGACLNKLGEWEYEPQPSSRDDEFLERCRYAALEEAIAALDSALTDGAASDTERSGTPTPPAALVQS